MNIEIVKEVNLAEVIEKLDDTQTIAGVALSFAILAFVVIALFVYVVVTVSNGQDKDIKKLQEECKRLSYLNDRYDDLRSKCDLVYKEFVHRGIDSKDK